MAEPIMVKPRDGVLELVGDWPIETSLEPQVLGQALEQHVRTTVKFELANGWALYRVVGYSMQGHLLAKRIRRGRGKAKS